MKELNDHHIVALLRGTFYGSPVQVVPFSLIGEPGEGLQLLAGSQSWKLAAIPSAFGGSQSWKVERLHADGGYQLQFVGSVFQAVGVLFGQVLEEIV